MKNGRLQCKDIPDAPILEFLGALPPYEDGTPCTWGTFYDAEDGMPFHNSVSKVMPPGIPEKLMKAKIAMLMRRGLVDACLCGCRGDIELTDKGWLMVEGSIPAAEGIRIFYS